VAIAGAHRSAVGRGHRLERRNRRRRARATARWAASLGGWSAFFLVLGWLVAAGFYGLVNP
ncbi:MAG: hypothetical protein M3Z28_06330, partial [Candidatus Dormibacteraeota bacterium]|nr:hypothetical protein [Candidatus Dormibacteraeota bacterium]